MKIIGITGKIGSGKDAVSKYLVKEHGFKSISIGDLINEDHLKKYGRSNIELISTNSKNLFLLNFKP